MMKRHVLWPAALAATLALAACGGDGGDGPNPMDPALPPAPPTPQPVASIDRIEPLDTIGLKLAPLQKEQAVPAASRLPAGAAVPRVALGPLDQAKAAVAPRPGLLMIGQGRAVPATAAEADLAAQLKWNALGDGSQVAALAFSAEGAQAIRLGVLARQLPAGAVLRFYGASDEVVEMTAAQVDALRRTNEAGGLTGDAARMVWGPDTAGAVSTLEVQIPAGAAAGQVKLAVPLLSHLTQTAAQAMTDGSAKFGGTSDIGASCSANVDMMCEQSIPVESRSVAKLEFVAEGGGTALCTGTLLNDSLGSRTPYVLTASHCIPGQTEAGSLITYWFFRSAYCNSSPVYDGSMTRVTGGARLLQADMSVDHALLQMVAQPPAGVLYAGSYFGWDTLPNPAQPNDPESISLAPTTVVFGIHHPMGDLQKFSSGAIAAYSTCGGGYTGLDCFSSSMSVEGGTGYVVQLGHGVTQEGSSGSALFASSDKGVHYVVGALTGGPTDICTNPQDRWAVYGRFDQAFYHGLKTWLNPTPDTNK